MRAVLKTNDPVELSFAKHVLTEAGVGHVVFDEQTSVVNGSLGMVPRRLMVADDDYAEAVLALSDNLTGYMPPEGR